MHSCYNYKTVPFYQLGLFWINENHIGNIFDHIYFIMSVTISAYQLTSMQDRGYTSYQHFYRNDAQGRIKRHGLSWTCEINKSILRGLFSVFGIITIYLIEGKLACLKTRHTHTCCITTWMYGDSLINHHMLTSYCGFTSRKAHVTR